ncbi:hypothetical protein B0A50_01849 [Salinomyces thailandicus]|uniref:ELMO domain-containing protein n=1 Tax=Salinomyces thailandicus TaxID=706561 RepID=A0A4U0U8X5_9PEZI|nr:hypothetical protein B0A50_01849 [Salinomyces thailandica]
MDDLPPLPALITSLISDTEPESARKFAVFKLQHALGDPAYAERFRAAQGLLPLRHVVLTAVGNTQAYALGSLDALLELDVGWEAVDAEVIRKAVELAAGHPLINIVRNALLLLVLVVGRPLRHGGGREDGSAGEGMGFQALKPALELYPTFLESLVQRLSASDHMLCANALQLVNALMRDAVLHSGEHEWPRFIKRLQDLGVIGGVGMLMRGDAAADLQTPLAAAILEFQGLTKLLLRKWREVRVNVELPEHKRALKTIHLLSRPEPYHAPARASEHSESGGGAKGSRQHHPEKWRRLGFETESPAWEFDDTGYLGIMDLVDFARRNPDLYHKTLLEQAVLPPALRCPLARASLSVTLILYEHFEIDDDATLLERPDAAPYIHSAGNPEKIYRPLLLQWGRLHTAALTTLLRLWKVSGAQVDADFFKLEELVRIIVERIVGSATRRTEIAGVELALRNVGLEAARLWQMQGLDEVYEDAWGPLLGEVRDALKRESMAFMKEQRVRCLLAGAWFYAEPSASAELSGGDGRQWRYVCLSHNRKYLHHGLFASRGASDAAPPDVADLHEKLNLDAVTSVDSNVSAADPVPAPQDPASLYSSTHRNPSGPTKALSRLSTTSSVTTLRTHTRNSSTHPAPPSHHPPTTSQITILGLDPYASNDMNSSTSEAPLLTLHPPNPTLASEWLDGLLMLLHQQPITASTTQLVEMLVDWGLRLRMLNLRWEDVEWEALEARVKGEEVGGREVPGREGIEGEEFWYGVGGV